MGSLGWQETIFIFVFALLIFGPKKLPELGKTIGKAMGEFRRASSDLKATFDREMHAIERENQDLKQTAQSFQNEMYNNDSSYYDSGAYGSDYDSSTYNQQDSQEPKTDSGNSSTVSASATQGAEEKSVAQTGPSAPPAAETAQVEARNS